MNPLRWSSEHQLAWILVTALGAMGGLVMSLTLFFPASGRMLIVTMRFMSDGSDADMVFQVLETGMAAGAVLSAMVFYIVKLLIVGK